MTGYGRGECATAARKFIVEIRSVNGKSLDLSFRAPAACRALEQNLRASAGKVLLRGKSDISVAIENVGGAVWGAINRDLFRGYYKEIVNLSREVGYELESEPLLSVLLRMPDVVSGGQDAFDQADIAALTTAADAALKAIDDFRAQEGAVLIADLLKRIATIGDLLSQVEPYENERIEGVRARLLENLAKAEVNVDSNRFEAEVIYYLEKFDVTEEKVRLKQHLKYFCEVAADGGDAGRKLGFIAQEIGREVNTLGSKANHHEIQRIVVQMKDELEKIKEQVLNLL